MNFLPIFKVCCLYRLQVFLSPKILWEMIGNAFWQWLFSQQLLRDKCRRIFLNVPMSDINLWLIEPFKHIQDKYKESELQTLNWLQPFKETQRPFENATKLRAKLSLYVSIFMSSHCEHSDRTNWAQPRNDARISSVRRLE